MQVYLDFLLNLQHQGFEGDIITDDSTLVVYSTDNSIYELKPYGVLFPKNENAVELIFTILRMESYRTITITARGGGTSTNGQSVNTGLIVDYSRYMNKILEINPHNKTATVQPGVILDSLNKEAKKYGLFFPPNISPSNRATIGGMVNTDACGKGSCLYGRTSDNIVDLSLHLLNESQPFMASSYSQNVQGILSPILRRAKSLCNSGHLVRTVTGYNVEKSLEDGNVNINYLVSGSEGTLSLVSKIIVKLQEIPAGKRMLLLQYQNFDDALSDAQSLLLLGKVAQGNNEGNFLHSQNFALSAIETVDENVLQIARGDIIWDEVSHFIGQGEDTSVNIVEFSYKTVEAFIWHGSFLENYLKNISKCTSSIKNTHYLFKKYFIIENEKEINSVWNLRKQGVGLLGAMKAKRRPLPFVEDTIVPPENLAEYIKGFRKILEKHNLKYGMFGHVDAGCLHVRPALDMKQSGDRALIRIITDEVAELLIKHRGVLWGEHGKGFRSEYTEKFFGRELYQSFQHIKTVFDKHNQLNPSKIAVVGITDDNFDGSVAKVDKVQTRGQLDEKISHQVQNEFENILSCNGNALCYNFETNFVMCPSYKVTNDRTHSPKGRAMLFKEWVRRSGNLPSIKQNIQNNFWKNFVCKVKNLIGESSKKSFETEVYNAFSKCLGCKACNTQCPIKVSIPDAKAYFLSIYFQKHFRTLQDYTIANIERILQIMGKFPKVSNFVLGLSITKLIAKRCFGVVDVPQIHVWNPKISNTEAKVTLLREAFVNYYHADVLKSAFELLTKLGYNTTLTKVFENGKGLHAKGFLNRFRKIVKRNVEYLQKQNGTLISVDPSLAVSYTEEYPRFLEGTLQVLYLPEFLASVNIPPNIVINNGDSKLYHLILHCTEQTNIKQIEKIWKDIFQKFNINLNVLKLGCCGMSGSFGNEVQNFDDSSAIYKTNWQNDVSRLINNKNNVVMVSGSSCKTQLQRFENTNIQNPIEVLNSLVFV